MHMPNPDKIPAPLISLFADRVHQLETHAGIDSLFYSADAPGDPPEGSKHVKCLEWLRRINKEYEKPLDVFGSLIESYVEYEPVKDEIEFFGESISRSVDDPRLVLKEQLTQMLLKYGLKYSEGGYIRKDGVNFTKHVGSEAIVGKTSVSDIKKSEIHSKTNNNLSKIFISHASADEKVVRKVVDLLEAMGVNSQQIFCSSLEGYGIKPGANFLETIKDELNSNSMVLFVLSDNFYNSRVCLCEMGAAWVLSKHCVPIVVPPFKFEDIEGVIPLTQGIAVNDKYKLNSLKETIEDKLAISVVNSNIWESKRDKNIDELNSLIASYEARKKQHEQRKKKQEQQNIDYALARTEGGAVVLKSTSEPEHFVCPNCKTKEDKNYILQSFNRVWGTMTCPNKACNSTFEIYEAEEADPRFF
ncbi:hypothetical protein A1OK_15395 [Enterovibrio norvegicus FF-454]|uniref:TIR domain-containing protein n=1 Tax=Enterovibrio norvegicus FF-454 TaxID=1185651 RepID=A0A1E5BYV1_9GAMM|nr:TIR domain-containing protein [Enterovibrio norvegicus]OEE58379.1 hypothetical protein A1OK_15395 [Enterovibrio norvegicus FF-454]